MVSRKQKNIHPSSKSKTSISPCGSVDSVRSDVTLGLEGVRSCETVNQNQFDAMNPMYHEPFKYGWKRELVYRGKCSNGVDADVYYYPPKDDKGIHEIHSRSVDSEPIEKHKDKPKKRLKELRKYDHNKLGVKLRSLISIAAFLKSSCPNSTLTKDNFTLVKQPLCINDPEKEIIRTARAQSQMNTVKKRRNKKYVFEKVADNASSTISAQNIECMQKTSDMSSASQTRQQTNRKCLKRSKSSSASSRKKVPPKFHQNPSSIRKSQRIAAKIPISSSANSTPNICQETDQTTPTGEFVIDENVHQSLSAPGISNPDRNSPNEVCDNQLQGTSFIALSPTLTTPDLIMDLSLTQNFDPVKLSSQSSGEQPMMEITATESHSSGTLVDESATPLQKIHSESSCASKDFDTESGIMSIDTEIFETKMEPEIEIVDTKEFLSQANNDTAGETFKFKVYIRQENGVDYGEVRRFSIKFQDASIYLHLCETLRTNYPDLADKNFTVRWKDSEGDDILITTDMDLREALQMRRRNLTRLNLTILGQH